MNGARTIIFALFGLLGIWTVDGGYIPCPDHNDSLSAGDEDYDEPSTTMTYAAQTTPAPIEDIFTGPSFEWSDPRDPDGDSIVGVAGKDYPTLAYIYRTNFTCSSERQATRYFADVGARCQVFHVCLETGGYVSFLCPNGTMFNEVYSVCDWWYNVNCDGIGGNTDETATATDGSLLENEDEDQETDLNGQAFTVAIPRRGQRLPPPSRFSRAHL